MSFENVKVNLLSGALSNCSKNVDFSSTTECISQLYRNTIWECSAKNNLLSELNYLVNTKYQELNRTLEKCQGVVGLISEYKDYENKKIINFNKINSLENQLYYEEPYTTFHFNKNGKKLKTISYRTVMDPSVKYEIDNLEREIDAFNREMERIEREVSQVTY